MTEVFRKYCAGEAEERPEDKEPIACIVRHPDAGGPCQREAIGVVVGLIGDRWGRTWGKMPSSLRAASPRLKRASRPVGT